MPVKHVIRISRRKLTKPEQVNRALRRSMKEESKPRRSRR